MFQENLSQSLLFLASAWQAQVYTHARLHQMMKVIPEMRSSELMIGSYSHGSWHFLYDAELAVLKSIHKTNPYIKTKVRTEIFEKLAPSISPLLKEQAYKAKTCWYHWPLCLTDWLKKNTRKEWTMIFNIYTHNGKCQCHIIANCMCHLPAIVS